LAQFPETVIPAAVAPGAAWTYGNGNLGLSENTTGNIYQGQIIGTTSASPSFTIVSTQTGPASSSNDGTSCTGAPVDLQLTKAAAPEPVATGGNLTFTLSVLNSGPGNSSGFVVTDPIPAEMTNPATTTAGGTINTRVLSCVEGPPANSDTFPIALTGAAPSTSGPVINTATVAGNELDATPGNNTSTSTTTVASTQGSPMFSPVALAPALLSLGGFGAIVIRRRRRRAPGARASPQRSEARSGPAAE
jgi:uncharacterized repeat protein (TIGR01451 family)